MENNWYDNHGANNAGPQYYQPDQKQKGKKRFSLTQFIVCLLVVALLSGCIGAGGLWIYNKFDQSRSENLQSAQRSDNMVVEPPNTAPAEDNAPNDDTQDQRAAVRPAAPVTHDGTASAGINVSTAGAQSGDPIVDMIQGCMASAVGITTKVSANAYYSAYGYNYKKQENAENPDELEYGSGSGIIITENGYIVTCAHVISGGETVYVCMQDGTEYQAQVVGRDAQTDIAVLKIDANDLPAATLGNSSNAVVGETVYAVGNPLGEFICSVSTGIISGLDRTLDMKDGINLTLMQTDAAVNPGNSGGGLFSSRGELIGIVNAKASSVGVEGLGFAIPVDSIKGIIADLMDLGYVSGRPYLGVTLQDMYMRDNSSASDNPFGVFQGYFGYGYTTHTQIVSIEKGSAAEKADLRVNDVILKLDDKEISGASDFTSRLYEYKVGDTVTLTILRGDDTIELPVTLGERAS